MTDIDNKSNKFEQISRKRTKLNDIRQGQDQIHNRKTSYLPQNEGETDDEYLKRLSMSVFRELTNEQITILSSKPFKQSVLLETENSFISSLNNNFDGFGTTCTQFSKSFFEESLWDSQAHVFIDFPVSQKDSAGNFTSIKKGRPTAVVLDNDNILNARMVDGVLVHLRLLETNTVPDSSGFDEVELKSVRIYNRTENNVTFSVFSQMEEDGDFMPVVQNESFSLNYIPLISLYPNGKPRTPFDPKLIFEPMANMNIRHYQSYSEQSWALRFNRIPILFGKALENKDGLVIGAGRAVISDDPQADLKIVEAGTGNAMKLGQDDVDNAELAIEKMGFEMISRKSGSKTATESNNDVDNTNSLLGCYALALQEALNKIIIVMLDWHDSLDADFSINVQTDFTVDFSDEDLRTLREARAMGEISQESYLRELKLRKVLSEHFDIEKDAGPVNDFTE